MKPIHVYFISCPALVNKRLGNIRRSFNALSENTYIKDITIVHKDDSFYRQQLGEFNFFDDEVWDEHLESCSDIFLENLKNSRSWSQIDKDQANIEIVRNLFPARKLSPSEMSVSLRHRWVWMQSCCSNGISVVFEDDAHVDNCENFNELFSLLPEIHNVAPFIDLADDRVVNYTGPITKYFSNELPFSVIPVARTRTLMAYSYSNSSLWE